MPSYDYIQEEMGDVAILLVWQERSTAHEIELGQSTPTNFLLLTEVWTVT